MSRSVVGSKVDENGECIYVEAPFGDEPATGNCVWCGQKFQETGDMRCIAMLTKNADGECDWYSGEFIHGTCDYERCDATDNALSEE